MPEPQQEPIANDPLDTFENEVEREVDQQSEAIEGALQTEQDRVEQQRAEDEAARMGAAMAVSFFETGLKMWKGYLVLPEENKQALIEKGAPVAKKYGGELPEWLQPYKEEVELGAVLLGTVAGIVIQIKAHEAEERAKREKDQPKQPTGVPASHEISTGQSEFRTS